MKTSTIVVAVVIIIIIIVGGVFALTYLATTTTTTATTTTPTTATTTTTTTTTPPGPIKIGIMEDTVGPVAAFASETITMAQVAAKQINDSGGINGRMIQLFVANEAPNGIPDPSSAANQLVLQDGVIAIVGITYAGDAVAVIPFLSQHHILTFFTTASNNNLMDNVTNNPSQFQYFFRVTSQDTQYSSDVANFVANVTHAHTVFFVAEDLAFSHEIFDELQANHGNLTITGSTFVPLSQTDFQTLATQIGNNPPDVVIDAQTGIGSQTFVQELKANPNNAHVQVVYISNGALADPFIIGQTLSTHPAAASDLVLQIFPGTNATFVNSVEKALAGNYTALSQFHSPYYAFPSSSYAAVEILAAAIGKTNSLNASVLVPALESINYTGPAGTYTFDAKHNWNFPGFWYIQIQNGTIQVIAPAMDATATYVKP